MFGVGARQIGGADECPADEKQGQDYPHHTHRVGEGAAQGGAVGLLSEQLERLLGGTQGRGVGRGAAQNARHAGHGDSESVAQPYGGSGAERDDRDGGEQQAHAVGAHRAEETGSHLQPEGIDEQHEAETLDVGQHRRVDRQSAVSGQNPHEEDERRSE